MQFTSRISYKFFAAFSFSVVLFVQTVCSEDLDLVEEVESIPDCGSPPYPREGSFIQYINTSQRRGLLIGGGRDVDGIIMKDAYFFDLNKMLWSIANTFSLDILPDRYMCISFCIEDDVYIWGGLSSRGLSNELLSYDFERISWKVIQQSDSIPCERYAACKAETKSHVYIFGGQGSHGLLNDIWEMDKQTFLWRCLRKNDPTKNPPPMRDGGACVFKDSLFIFGGLTSNVKEKPCAYKINLSNPDDCQLIEIITNYPFSGAIFRSGFTSYVSETECFGIIWGGKEGTMTRPIDKLYFLNLTAAGLNSAVKNASLVPFYFDGWTIGYVGASCTVDEEGTIYAFGGKDESFISNELCSLNKEDWAISQDSRCVHGLLDNTSASSAFLRSSQSNHVNIVSQIANHVPLPVLKHHLAELNGEIAAIGGYNPELNKMVPVNKKFNPQEMFWLELGVSKYQSEGKPSIGEAGVASLNGKIFVFGGATYDSNGDFLTMSNALWEYSQATLSWRKIKVKGEKKPPKMCRSGATIYESILYIVGGCDIDKNLNRDIWTFNFATSEWFKIYSYVFAIQRPIVFVKDIFPREYSINDNKSNHQHLKNTQNGKKVLNEKVKEDDEQPIPHLFVCGGDDGESPMEGCRAHPLKATSVYHDWARLSGPYYPIGSSGVVVGEGEAGFVVGGEESGIAKKSYLSVFTFDEYGEIKLATHKYDEGREETDFSLVRGSCAFMIDSLYCLGGHAVSEGMTPLPIATNKLTKIKLKNHLSGCSPGSFFNESKKQCDFCEDGSYSSHFNQTKCEKCPVGTSLLESGASISACVPCKDGIYQPETGSKECIKCDLNSSCIVGSASEKNTLQRKPFECTEQPKSYNPNSNKETMFTVLFYGVSLTLGLIVAVVCFCLPTRDKLYKLDQYSNTYKDVLDEKTHKAIKTVKKTSYGGCVSIIGICFVVGAASAVIVLFFLINTLENRIYVDSKILNITLDKFSNKKIEFLVRLRDYSGECINDVKDKQIEAKGKCSPLLGIGKSSYDPLNTYPAEPAAIEPICYQSPSPNKLFTPTADCTIQLSAENISIDAVDRQAKLLSFYSKEKDALFYGIDGFISVDSGIRKQEGYFFIDSTYKSQAESHFDGDSPHVFKGGEQTQVVAELMVSKYEENKWKHIVQMGNEASKISIKPGSQAKREDIGFAMSVGVDIYAELSQTVVVTTRSFKTSAVGLITALGGTFVYLNYIGKLIPVVEFIFSGKLFCGCCKKKWKKSNLKRIVGREPLLNDERKKIQMESDDVTQDMVGYAL
ncbi:uncharacterized protein MONOS_14539 [Monocercomonoides exilis]|uniref:uncharacterized protein n=1 Tax=Monocercomonoides exilis TaxID=2049356 RepID=UPI0035598DF4|nr:hypothetical protein MONOS_14539 [Monocercomonoides exilis]|eukprot:MONOS_14539.1-p1 / transcript=MONOS_14539.1 / gene=MONOS_14539 / organism=Monocercomonoides_exilis_PA203 / gene_product=unspecified product / transcript_product=unspecified product / location=Mono_scaffold01020:10803-14771(-) / protein_length=1284 / sequence_SO=supercontig / SO=protein_coding / is_pseudo=false